LLIFLTKLVNIFASSAKRLYRRVAPKPETAMRTSLFILTDTVYTDLAEDAGVPCGGTGMMCRIVYIGPAP